jgi:glycerol kinase
LTTAAEIERLAKESNPSEPVLFVPGLVGLGAPHWVPEARGVIFGLTRATTAADLGRAALEGVAFQVADLIDAAVKDLSEQPGLVRQSSGERPLALKVDGGMAANDWFLQCQADVLGRAVERAAERESTALGAAFLAGVGVGLTDETKLTSVVSAAAKRFEPRISSADREKKLAAWRKAVKAVVAFYSA